MHGDIKPQNVLVFKENKGRYRARVTDFGYATQFADERSLVRLPISLPWNAPEHNRLNREWIPSQARKADMFSFGLTCFWLVFEPFLSGSLESNLTIGFASAPEETSLMTISRNKKELQRVMQGLIAAHTELEGHKAAALKTYFDMSLNGNPEKRNFGLRRLLNNLTSQRWKYINLLPI